MLDALRGKRSRNGETQAQPSSPRSPRPLLLTRSPTPPAQTRSATHTATNPPDRRPGAVLLERDLEDRREQPCGEQGDRRRRNLAGPSSRQPFAAGETANEKPDTVKKNTTASRRRSGRVRVGAGGGRRAHVQWWSRSERGTVAANVHGLHFRRPTVIDVLRRPQDSVLRVDLTACGRHRRTG